MTKQKNYYLRFTKFRKITVRHGMAMNTDFVLKFTRPLLQNTTCTETSIDNTKNSINIKTLPIGP